jgi:hypothetical protein
VVVCRCNEIVGELIGIKFAVMRQFSVVYSGVIVVVGLGVFGVDWRCVVADEWVCVG